jgi:hypothetical protein
MLSATNTRMMWLFKIGKKRKSSRERDLGSK